MLLDVNQTNLLPLIQQTHSPFPNQSNSKIEPVSDIQLIKDYLFEIGPLPDGSVILGKCQDRYPVIFNLYDSKAGSFLILGDPGSGKTRLLISLLQAASILNMGKVSLDFITAQTYTPNQFGLSPILFEAYYPYQSDIKDRIMSFSTLARKRLAGRLNGPIILLAIDDLFLLQSYLDEEDKYELNWLIQYGSLARIWTIATATTISYENFESDPFILDTFKTIVLGNISDPSLLRTITRNPLFNGISYSQEGEFYILYKKEWLRFYNLNTLQ